MTRGMLDFGATDGPMSDDAARRPRPRFCTSTVLGTVVVTFNVEHVDRLRFDARPSRVSFSARSRRGTTRRSSALTRCRFPTLRSRSCIGRMGAARRVFADYLSKVSADWKRAVGGGTSVRWPVGVGANGNDGVAGLVKPRPIPSASSSWSMRRSISSSTPQCRAAPGTSSSRASTPSRGAAAAAASHMPADFRVSITDADAPDAYPISSFTWLLVPARIAEVEKGDALRSSSRGCSRTDRSWRPNSSTRRCLRRWSHSNGRRLERIKVGE